MMALMVVKLSDKIRYGKNCESNCKKGDEDYYWCWTGWNLNEVFFFSSFDGWQWMKTDENRYKVDEMNENG